MGLRYPFCFGLYSFPWIHCALATLVLGSTIDLCALVTSPHGGLTHHIIPRYLDLLVPLQLGLANVAHAAGAPMATMSP